MAWTVFRWVWQVQSPLYVGAAPSGMLNRCRLYLPARAMHGAVTAELARLNGEEKTKFPDYGKFGREVGVNCRFTYLFPAEKHDDDFLTWMPRFEKAKGLQWTTNHGKDSPTDREFRRRILDTRPGTAIAPETDSATEGTLHEMECINPWWRDSDSRGKSNPVLMLGYVLLRNNSFCNQLQAIETLFVGGDTRYGLGKICRVAWQKQPAGSKAFGKPIRVDTNGDPEIESDVVWAHALLDGSAHDENYSTDDRAQKIWGAQELLSGWDYNEPWKGKLAWAPGSSFEEPVAWAIDTYGYWIYTRSFDRTTGS